MLIRYFAGAAEAAGADTTEVAVSSGSTLAEVVRALGEGNPRLAQVLEHCTFLLDGRAAPSLSVPLESIGAVDVLPPFAGG